MTDKKTWGPHNRPKNVPRPEKLTDREKRLAQGLVGGLSNAAALRKAGYAAGSFNCVADKPHFVEYLAALRNREVERLDYTVDNLCARLEHIAFEATAHRQYGPAVQAVMGIAKMMGHLADKSEIELHLISKPMREPTKELELSPEAWQRQFAPKQVQ